jgi:hypothetical protein
MDGHITLFRGRKVTSAAGVSKGVVHPDLAAEVLATGDAF